MSFSTRLTFAFFAFFICFPYGARGDAIDEFRSQYKLASERLDEEYREITINDNERVTDKLGNLIYGFSSEYMREGDHCRCVQTILKSTVPNAQPGFVRAFGGNSDKHFDIFKKNPIQRFAILDFGASSPDDFSGDARTRCVPAYITTCFDEERIRDLIQSWHAHILSISQANLDGQAVVQVKIDQVGADPASQIETFYFLPQTLAFAGVDAPVILPGHTMSDPHQSVEFRVDYVGSDPMKIKRIDRWTDVGVPGVKANEHEYVINSIKVGPIPLDEFTMAALNADEPGAAVVLRRSWRWIWIIDGLAILSLAFVLIWWRNKSQRQIQ